MGECVVRLDDVPVRHRFGYWWELVAKSVVSVDASSRHATDFWAEMRSVDLGAVHLSRVRCVDFTANRTARHIRGSDPEAYQLSVTVRGRSGIRQGDGEALLAPTDLVLYDTSRPFNAWSSPDALSAWNGSRGNMADGVIVHIPHDVLRISAAAVKPMLARRIPGRGGVAAVFGNLLHHLLSQADRLSPTDRDRLSVVVIDLVTALLAHELEIDPASFTADPGRVLVLRIQEFIERRLDDLSLTPADIAAAHHISLRQMQRLFHQEGHTVSGWVQHRRLERCRHALADSLMEDVPINAIAARLGFASDAHFNRLFRRTYGLPPASYRRRLRDSRLQPAREAG
ncbi:helix-turn-helix domain-containing protein [Sphaerisporangium sp. TRM90804]|uniref:AraC-like ligand-binding domain-containing protein n=1 Tax=Sphaerisporangium sp. TRM90804 TaxID=3031113 RepID=UPI00244A64CA|nr:helix-turn-helix domain-containing protein [Sphaerisporangium sp. TRM90804]MDH2424868.1 helix-turn-helix domain-containing protein [Sphaerisporangium sp. TRM90804]